MKIKKNIKKYNKLIEERDKILRLLISDLPITGEWNDQLDSKLTKVQKKIDKEFFYRKEEINE
jgi:hypothetical protein